MQGLVIERLLHSWCRFGQNSREKGIPPPCFILKQRSIKEWNTVLELMGNLGYIAIK